MRLLLASVVLTLFFSLPARAESWCRALTWPVSRDSSLSEMKEDLAVVPKAHLVLDTNLPKDSLAVVFKGTCTADLVTKRRPAKYMGPEQREKK